MFYQVNGGQLPPHVVPFCIVAAAIAACLPVAAHCLSRVSLQAQLQPHNAHPVGFAASLAPKSVNHCLGQSVCALMA